MLDFAIRTAERGAEALKHHRGERSADFKGRRDLVTEADRASERAIVEAIAETYPDHGIYAEEEVRKDAAGGEGYLWVIDPLDGTTNFVHGLPIYAVSIGLLRNGEPTLGVVLIPELGECFSAERGKGAYLNGKPIRVSENDRLDHALLSTGFHYNRNDAPYTNLENFCRLNLAAREVRRCGSAATDLAWTACGRFDGFWEGYLAPYDVAAGVCIAREAGGTVTTFAGAPDVVFARNILVTNGRLHDAIAERLDPFPE